MLIKQMQRILTSLLCGLLLLINPGFTQSNVKIGVLTHRGAAACLKQWKSTADYLSQKIPGKTFVVIPLDFEKVEPAIKGNEIDYLIANSSIFVEMNKKYDIIAVASLVNSVQNKPAKEFGGLILTRADNTQINQLADLKGKKFMAVEENSFGGWQMAWRELKAIGIDPQKDFTQLLFGGTHDNVILAIKNKTVDAGTVRTDTYERMAADGKIKLEDFKVINKQEHPGFPFACSTRLYPEWPIAGLKHVTGEERSAVLAALLEMKESDTAAKDAKIVNWIKPLDYKKIEQCLKDLGL